MLLPESIERLEDYCRFGGKAMPPPPHEHRFRGGHGAPLSEVENDTFRKVIDSMQEVVRSGGIADDSLSRESSQALTNLFSQIAGSQESARTGDVLNVLGWWSHMKRADRLHDLKPPDDLSLSMKELRECATRQHLEFMWPSVTEIPILLQRNLNGKSGRHGWLALRAMIAGLNGLLDFPPHMLSIDQALELKGKLALCIEADEYIRAYDYPLLLNDSLLWEFVSCRDLGKSLALMRAHSFNEIFNHLQENYHKSNKYEFHTHREFIAQWVVNSLESAPLRGNILLTKALLHFVLPFSDVEKQGPPDVIDESLPNPPLPFAVTLYMQFMKYWRGYSEILGTCASADLSTLDLAWREYISAVQTADEVPFGYAFHLLPRAVGANHLSTQGEIRSVFKELFGNRVTARKSLSQSEMHRYCSLVAQELLEKFGTRDARHRWEHYGYIVSDIAGLDNALPTVLDNAGVSILTPLEQRRAVMRSATTAYSDGKEPQNFYEAHKRIAQLDDHDKIWNAMDEEADGIKYEIQTHKMKGTLATRVSSRTIKRTPAVIRYGVARRVVLSFAFGCRDEYLTGQKAGFQTNMKADTPKAKITRRRNIENFEKYLKLWQLKEMNFTDPENSVILTDDERKYLFQSPPV